MLAGPVVSLVLQTMMARNKRNRGTYTAIGGVEDQLVTGLLQSTHSKLPELIAGP